MKSEDGTMWEEPWQDVGGAVAGGGGTSSKAFPTTQSHHMIIIQGLCCGSCRGLAVNPAFQNCPECKKIGQDLEFLVDGGGLTSRRDHHEGKIVPFDPKQFPKRLELAEFCPVEISLDNPSSVPRTQMVEGKHELLLVVL